MKLEEAMKDKESAQNELKEWKAQEKMLKSDLKLVLYGFSYAKDGRGSRDK